jgi:quinoprotein glucose dehydrogenase
LNRADRISDDRRSLEVAYKWQWLLDDEGHPGSKPPWGTIASIDLNSGRKLWQVPFGEYAELTRRGVKSTGQPNYGGLIVTKGGLIFATGTIDKKIRAYDMSTGAQLWDYDLPASGSAPPSTYEVDGVQYVIVVATGGLFAGFKERSDTIMAFKLGAARPNTEGALPK